MLLLGTLAKAAEPANKAATPAAREVLNCFCKLSAQKDGARIVSGQFTDFGHGANLAIMEKIHEKSGHWPGLLGADYADFSRGSLTCKIPNQAAIAYWKQGGLVTISAHLYNPANEHRGGLRDKGVDLEELLKSDSEVHRRWMFELDQMADGLQELKAAGVVVLWRPFHEMNGDWFWWCAKDPAVFAKVWQHMFDYYTKTKGLDNLLWVYSPNHGRSPAKYYPGDAFVDLVGLDAYTDFVDRKNIHGFDEVIALGKPFGFTEFGPGGSHGATGDYDYRRFLEGVQKNFPQTCFFMCWNAKWSLAANHNCKELLDNPAIVNRDALPDFLKPKP